MSDLRAVGAVRYAKHPSTEIICLGWCFDDEQPKLWFPDRGPFPQEVLDHLHEARPRSIAAYNAAFEALLFTHVVPNYTELTPPPISAYYDTAAQTRIRGYPARLEDAAWCLGLGGKDPRGARLINQLSKHKYDQNGDIYFIKDPALIDAMGEYCITDVITEREVAQQTQPLTDREQKYWVANQIIANLGIPIDRPLATAAAAKATIVRDEINAKLDQLTNGEMKTAGQFRYLHKILEPLREQNPAIKEATTVVRRNPKTGVLENKFTTDRSSRWRLQTLEREQPGTLPQNFKEVLELIDGADSSSVRKFERMLQRVDPDDRVRHAIIWPGTSTARASSVGIQVHNFPRTISPNLEQEISDLIGGVFSGEDQLRRMSGLLRGGILAGPGKLILWADLSQIEARMCALQTGDERLLQTFAANDRDPNAPDVYRVVTAGILDKPATAVTSAERQLGKVAALSLNYGGSVAPLRATAAGYGMVLSEDEAQRIVQKYRSDNEPLINWWRDLEDAAQSAVLTPGVAEQARAVTFYMPPGSDTLLMENISGRVLSYPQARVDVVDSPFGERYQLSALKASIRRGQDQQEWPRFRLYGGLLCENAVQAASADILMSAISELVELQWPVCAHVHDEIVLEIDEDEVEEASEMVRRALVLPPEWAKGLPLACEINHGKRWGK